MQPLMNTASFDDSPIARLYDRYASILLNYISRYSSSKEDADDLLLEVFTVALENQVWSQWSEGEQLAWLRRIAHNKAVDHYRRGKRYSSVALEATEHMLYENDEHSPEQALLRQEEYTVLRAHLSNLSDLQQEIILLRFGYNLRSKEIAQRLQKSDNVIRVHLSRALQLLRRRYQQERRV